MMGRVHGEATTRQLSECAGVSGDRLKVLVSVHACGPGLGSEPGLGWGWVQALSQYHDLWVITEKDRFQASTQAELARHPQLRQRLHFQYLRKVRKPRLQRICPPLYYRLYRAWQFEAMKLATKLHREVGFDLVHQLNFTGYWEPGYLWQLPLPFVWGPTGGFHQLPWRFLPSLGVRGGSYHLVKNVVNAAHLRFAPRPRAAARRAGPA